MRPLARAVRRQDGLEVQGHSTKTHIKTVLYKRRNERQSWTNLRRSVLLLLFGRVSLGFSMPPPLLGLGNGQWGVGQAGLRAFSVGFYTSRLSATAQYDSVSFVAFLQEGLAFVGAWNVRNGTSRFRQNAWGELYASPKTKWLPNCVSVLLSRCWRSAVYFSGLMCFAVCCCCVVY